MATTDTFNAARLRHVNAADVNAGGDYVLYWMQLYRRFDANHALNYALACAQHYQKPLVVYEGLKLGYPWASRRLHRFILEGMLDNRRAAESLGLTYWPFVETPQNSGRGLLRSLAAKAAVVVTDDFPCFIIPDQTAALAAKTTTPVIAVDGNSIVPISQLGAPVAAAAHLRPRIHRAFAMAWDNRAGPRRKIPDIARKKLAPPFETWQTRDLDKFLAALPLDASVPPVPGITGGSEAAKTRLADFVRHRLPGYAEHRSKPTAPADGHASGLSPYLHFGHISIEQVAEAVLGEDWTTKSLEEKHRGKREGYFTRNPDVNSFLDEALTWRDVGMNWHWARRNDAASLKTALPTWALATLDKHSADKRAALYTLEQFEAGETHDPLWNAAQRELVATGTIQNYLRMLWGKKVLEWSKTPETAYQTLVHLNNKYALDGRNPNSYTGILWCFGLFDRPWAPERDVYGVIRYMSSENTAKKFKLAGYYEYVDRLPTIEEVRTGKTRNPNVQEPKSQRSSKSQGPMLLE
jgi:deoxyribodipyrimidine photo-lyase